MDKEENARTDYWQMLAFGVVMEYPAFQNWNLAILNHMQTEGKRTQWTYLFWAYEPTPFTKIRNDKMSCNETKCMVSYAVKKHVL